MEILKSLFYINKLDLKEKHRSDEHKLGSENVEEWQEMAAHLKHVGPSSPDNPVKAVTVTSCPMGDMDVFRRELITIGE